MFKFLAIRIHNGELKLETVPEKFRENVKKAYKDLYAEEI